MEEALFPGNAQSAEVECRDEQHHNYYLRNLERQDLPREDALHLERWVLGNPLEPYVHYTSRYS